MVKIQRVEAAPELMQQKLFADSGEGGYTLIRQREIIRALHGSGVDMPQSREHTERKRQPTLSVTALLAGERPLGRGKVHLRRCVSAATATARKIGCIPAKRQQALFGDTFH